VILMVLMNIYPFQSWPVLFALTIALACATAFLTWTFIEAPALGHKDVPEKIVRRIMARILPAREAGAA
jgi:peptidoglycan/LPS O-acetylase OafA/YrhL